MFSYFFTISGHEFSIRLIHYINRKLIFIIGHIFYYFGRFKLKIYNQFSIFITNAIMINKTLFVSYSMKQIFNDHFIIFLHILVKLTCLTLLAFQLELLFRGTRRSSNPDEIAHEDAMSRDELLEVAS